MWLLPLYRIRPRLSDEQGKNIKYYLLLPDMTDIICPLKSFTKHDCAELKYSLRSIEKHLINVRDIYIVTDILPEWIINVKQIFCKDYIGQRNKEFNLATKLCCACLEPAVSNPFLMINDDHYLLSDYDASTFPFYYYGTLEQRIKQRKPNEIYCQSMINTVNALNKAHRETLYFDVHTPILYNKEQFLRIVKAYKWKNNAGYTIKSLYSNLMCIEGIEMEDCKLKPNEGFDRLIGRKWFSNSNLSIKDGLFEYLDKLFPHKSKYEL